MSAAIAFDRVDQIRAMLAALQPVAAQPAPATAFASTLQAATATTASTGTAATAATGTAASVPFAAEIDAAAARHGLDPALLRGLIRQESGFDPNARSSAGAMGLCQLMPATAAGLGVTNPSDPVQNIEGGAKYLKQQLDRFGGDVAKALAAYNAGPGAVQRYGGVPPYPETQNYVQRVTAYANEYRSQGAAAPAATASAALQASPVLTAALGVATPTVPAATAPASSSGLGYSTT